MPKTSLPFSDNLRPRKLNIAPGCFIALGKIGDIINILPILFGEYRKTGMRQTLMVARQYADLVRDLSYVNLTVFEGSWENLKDAIKLAKQNFPFVTVLSVYGKDFPFVHRTPSFLMEPWERAGKLAEFDSLPLVIDGRDEQRERRLLESRPISRPFILYADHGESSPFPHKEDLFKLLKDVSGRHTEVVRLSEIRAEHFFDFLALYEQAMLIVATETAHLHLTAATGTPVIAFTKDTPTRWHGSSHAKRFRLTCRYGDFERRRHEIVAAVQDPYGCRNLQTAVMTTQQPFGYNPTTLAGYPGMVYRYHPKKSWKTQLMFRLTGREFPLRFPEQFDGMSMEDPRLFWYQGKPHLSFVAARHEFGTTNAVTGYGEILFSNDDARLEKVFTPEFGMNNWGGIEKNWLFFEYESRLMCIYSCENGQQVVIEVQGNRVKNVMRSEALEWQWGKVRGGCLIPWKGRLLRFFHSHNTDGQRERWIYNIGAVTMEDRPPFTMLQMSKSPVIAGDEKLNLYCRHWKQNVVFPSGVVGLSPGWGLAYGYNDCECRIAMLDETKLNI